MDRVDLYLKQYFTFSTYSYLIYLPSTTTLVGKDAGEIEPLSVLFFVSSIIQENLNKYGFEIFFFKCRHYTGPPYQFTSSLLIPNVFGSYKELIARYIPGVSSDLIPLIYIILLN